MVFKLILVVLLLFVFSCCSSTKTLEKKSPFESGKSIIRYQNHNQEENISPNTIIVDLKIITIYKDAKKICGAKKTKTCLVEIVDVNKKGFGLRSNFIEGQRYLISFTEIKPDLKPGNIIKATVLEFPCLKLDEISNFLVIKYKQNKLQH